MNWTIIITMGLYLVGMVLVGVFFSKKNMNSTDEFYLGGRKLGPVVTAMSAEASDMSSWLLMGLPGLAYFSGIAEAAWTAIGLAVGTYLNFLFVSKRIRIYSEEVGAITVPQFFSARYKDDRNILRGIAAIIIVIFFVPYTASGFAAIGKLFSALFGFNYLTTMIIGAVIIILYTILGGFLAVSFTDLIQSIVMTIALTIVIFFGVAQAGGLGTVMANAKEIPGYLNIFKTANISTLETGSYGFIPILSTMAWGLGYFGMPHILLRFMGCEDPGKLKVSRRIGSIWVAISMAVAVFIGIVGYSVSKAGKIISFDSSSSAENVIVKIADLLSKYGIFAAIAAGLILAGILASTMSTADSQLLAASSSVSEDIISGLFGVKLSRKTNLLIARISVVVISVIGIFFALDENSSVFQIVSFAWGGFGATFAPAILASLFWKRTTKWGVLAGMVAGGSVIFIWKFLLRPLGGLWDIYELLPAFIIAAVVLVTVSLLTKKPEDEILEQFDRVSEKCKK